jgi:hypothetical protein
MSFVMAKTKHGGDAFECLSSLHKSIRRGLEEDAMLWALELLVSGENKESKNFTAMLYNYLVTIAYEDIGVGDPAAVQFVVVTMQQAREWHKAGKTGDTANLVACAVVALCRAQKARYAGHLESLVRDRLNRQKLPPVPDVALDLHTRRGRAMGRGLTHFLEEGALLFNENPDFTGDNDPYYKRVVEVWRRQYPEKGKATQDEADSVLPEDEYAAEPPKRSRAKTRDGQADLFNGPADVTVRD